MWESITVIEAQEQLKMFTVSDWPNMKKQAKQKLHKDLFRKAYPSNLKQKNYVTLTDLQKALGK